MIELLLLKSLFNRDIYRKYRHVVTISKELLPLLGYIDLWYKTNISDLTAEDLVVMLEVSNPRNKEYLQEALERLVSLQIPQDMSTLLQRVKMAQIASKLADEAFALSAGNSSVADVLKISQQLENPKDDTQLIQSVSSDLGEILRTTTGNGGLRWRLHWLNKSLGPLRKGDFGFVFARPETGKTTFLADQVTHMAAQSTGPILWFNNEEQGSKVMLRCYEAALARSLGDIRKDPVRAEADFKRVTGDRIQIIDDAGMSASRVDQIVAQLNPSLVVFDQIDKIKGFKNDREDLALGAIYQWARELAKGYSPVIGVCQASGDAEGEPYLHMGHVANARTAKQAEADFIVGIGKVHQSGYEYIRYLNISKNKLTGDEGTDPAMRHGRAEVLIKPEIARYIEA